ncbi:MAG: hypothetical protein K2Y33_20805 [Mycolicibacterium frederiksbergense]|nr:hypothetical protein [Mycolicibacterium frederiksbergense]
MHPNRKHHLDTQYVLSLVNDGDWYRRCGRHFDGSADELRHVPPATTDYIKRIAHSLGEASVLEERAYIYLQLAQHYGFTWTDMRDSIRGGGNLRDVMTAFIDERNNATPAPETPQPIQQEEPPVNQTTTAFETKHYVFGQDVSNMTEGQLTDAIKRIENEIADLKTVKTKSTKITAKIAELNAMLAKVVEVLDAK